MILRFLYTSLLVLISPFFLYGLYRTKPNKPKFGSRWKEHFGITSTLSTTSTPPIWIHAVSVGEVLAVTPLIKQLKIDNPEQTIVLTTTTSTGAEQTKKLGDLVEHRYMPLDFPFSIKRFITIIKPKALFIMETELWPNTLHCCQQYNIPITVINARLSLRSASRYKKFPFIFNLLLKNIDLVLAQTKQDAVRFIELGLKPQQVQVTGSIKFDISVTEQQLEQAAQLRQQFTRKEVWIAASTHKGEDEQIIVAHKQLLQQKPNALLILVPRHPERFASVKTLCESSGLSVITRSSQEPIKDATQLYLGDSMGEMMILLGSADICFIAGSLIGDKVGGHNLLEPAALEKPILNGPSYFNFKEITEQLVAQQACTICNDSHEITASLLRLFNDAKLRQQQGTAALNFVRNNQGALHKTSQAIQQVIGNPHKH